MTLRNTFLLNAPTPGVQIANSQILTTYFGLQPRNSVLTLTNSNIRNTYYQGMYADQGSRVTLDHATVISAGLDTSTTAPPFR